MTIRPCCSPPTSLHAWMVVFANLCVFVSYSRSRSITVICERARTGLRLEDEDKKTFTAVIDNRHAFMEDATMTYNSSTFYFEWVSHVTSPERVSAI